MNDNDGFNPPYASVADWWQQTDCRVMRIAVGDDNNYPDQIADVDDQDTDIDETTTPDPADTTYCGNYPGSDTPEATWIDAAVQAQVDKVGIALLNRMDRGRPSFNAEATGMPTISGVAQVGAELTVNTDAIRDVNDIPVDDDGDEKFNYQWLRRR